MKTSSSRTFTAFLTLPTTRRCSFSTGGTFSNSRAWSPFKATLNTILPKRDVRKCDPHSNVLCRFSLSWQWYMPCPRVTPPLFSKTHQHLFHSYVGPYDIPILVRMWRSEVPTVCYQAKARNVFWCIYRLSSTVGDCGSNVASALSDSKYTRVPLEYARPFITCHANNTVLCILLSRSNDEWTCIYARGIGTISGIDRAHGRIK